MPQLGHAGGTVKTSAMHLKLTVAQEADFNPQRLFRQSRSTQSVQVALEILWPAEMDGIANTGC